MKIPFCVRRTAEYLSRNVVLKRRLPRQFGSLPIYVTPAASLIYWRGLRLSAFNDLYDFAENYVHAGDTVWDVGGNVGVFSFAAAARAGSQSQVYTFEPDPASIHLLKRSAKLNHGYAASVEIIPIAIGASIGLEWLHVPERSRAASHLASTGGGAGPKITGLIRERHLTPMFTLDWLALHLPPPQVIKIDVDGAELGILQSARDMLQKHRPSMLVEVYERNADAVTALLHDLHYRLFRYENGEAGKCLVDRTTYNTLALPDAR